MANTEYKTIEKKQFHGKISATSDKQSEDYPSANPVKSIFFEPVDGPELEAMEGYLNKQAREGKHAGQCSHFILKPASSLLVYQSNMDKTFEKFSMSAGAVSNFTADPCSIMLEKRKRIITLANGTTKETTFYKLTAVNAPDGLQFVTHENPFADESTLKRNAGPMTDEKGFMNLPDGIEGEDLPFN